MADFVELDPGSGGSKVYVDELTVATSTLVAQRIKIELGADGVDDGPVNSGNPLPITLVSSEVSIGGGTQYVDGDTSTAPTGTVMLWKSAVSTLVPASTSNPFPVSTLPLTASLSATDNGVLDNISTFANSTNTILSQPLSSNTFRITIAADDVGIGGGIQYVDGNTTTLPTGTVMLWKSAVSTIVPASTSNPMPITTIGAMTVSSVDLQAISTYAASSNSLISTNMLQQSTRLNNISTFTNSTNTLLVQVSSNTASSNALLSTISARLTPVPTGIYVQPIGVSSNGLSIFRTLDADETEEQISATACSVYGIWVTNTSTTAVYLKLYNGTSSAIFVSSATPLITFGVPGSSTQAITGANLNVGGLGLNFSTACCVAATTGAADGNTGAPGESTVICNIFYEN